jgi:large subunit ribosomal protein L15
MQINDLKRKTPNKKSIQVGRGGTRGKTSGRGTKGQLSRSGRKLRPELRDIIKKLPKLRGRGKNSNLSIQTKPVIVKLETIEKVFANGDKVNPSTLQQKGVVPFRQGKAQLIKILGNGEFTKKVVISNCTISKGAKEIVEKVGGSVK